MPTRWTGDHEGRHYVVALGFSPYRATRSMKARLLRKSLVFLQPFAVLESFRQRPVQEVKTGRGIPMLREDSSHFVKRFNVFLPVAGAEGNSSLEC